MLYSSYQPYPAAPVAALLSFYFCAISHDAIYSNISHCSSTTLKKNTNRNPGSIMSPGTKSQNIPCLRRSELRPKERISRCLSQGNTENPTHDKQQRTPYVNTTRRNANAWHLAFLARRHGSYLSPCEARTAPRAFDRDGITDHCD